jgi:hypothetical protein
MNLNRNVLPIAIGLAASGAVNAEDINAWGPWESALGGGGGTLLNQLLGTSFGFTNTATKTNTDDSGSGQSFINTITDSDPIARTSTGSTSSLNGFAFTGYWAKSAAQCMGDCTYINHSGLFGQAGFNVTMGEGSAGNVNGVFLLGSGSQTVTSNYFRDSYGSTAPGYFYFNSKGLKLDGSTLAGRTSGTSSFTPSVSGFGYAAGAGQVYSKEHQYTPGVAPTEGVYIPPAFIDPPYNTMQVPGTGITTPGDPGSPAIDSFNRGHRINTLTGTTGALAFFTGETTPLAAMDALKTGSFEGTYTGSSAIYNQSVQMNVQFGPGTWTGQWGEGSFNIPDFNAAGTISGATISGAPTNLIGMCGTISGSIVGNFINTGCGTDAGGIIGATCITAPNTCGTPGSVFVDVFRVTGTPSSP